MRIAMYYNNNDIRLEEMPKPTIGLKELLVKVMACGICGSDVMEWYRIKKAPLVLGHEATGVIVEIGKEVNHFKVDDRVFVSHHVPCNTCRYCLNDHHTVCETLHTTNFFPGGFSEYIRVPPLNVDRGTFLLPPELSFEEGTFIEPLACVIRGQRQVHLKPGQNVLILGAGVSGLLHLLLARATGISRILVTDVNHERLTIAKQLGADSVIDATEDVPNKVRQANTGRLADLVIVSTNAYPAFQHALQSVDRAGTILLFAPTEPGVLLPLPVNDFWRNGITITHAYGASPQDIIIAIELLRKKLIPVQRMITHRLNLAQTGLGFKLVLEAKDALKVIVEPHRFR